MQKFNLVCLALCISLGSFGQKATPKFKLTTKGVEPIVIDLDTLTTPVIYSQTMNWIKHHYKESENVLKTHVQDELIRIEGYQENAWHYKATGKKYYFDAAYALQIEIKDNRVRLKYEPGQFWSTKPKSRTTYTYTTFFKPNGDPTPMYAEGKKEFEASMNNLVLSWLKFLRSEKPKDDW